MSLFVKVERISQDFDLNSGETANFLLLRLPNDTLVKALVGDDVAQMVVQLSVGAATTTHRPETVEEDVVEFGQEMPSNAQPKPVVRDRILKVEADERGNPIRRQVPPSDSDEDGINQL